MYTYVVANASAVFSRPQRKGSSTGDMGSKRRAPRRQVRGGEEGVHKNEIRRDHGAFNDETTRGLHGWNILLRVERKKRGKGQQAVVVGLGRRKSEGCGTSYGVLGGMVACDSVLTVGKGLLLSVGISRQSTRTAEVSWSSS